MFDKKILTISSLTARRADPKQLEDDAGLSKIIGISFTNERIASFCFLIFTSKPVLVGRYISKNIIVEYV